jgi:hypothetical protein
VVDELFNEIELRVFILLLRNMWIIEVDLLSLEEVQVELLPLTHEEEGFIEVDHLPRLLVGAEGVDLEQRLRA